MAKKMNKYFLSQLIYDKFESLEYIEGVPEAMEQLREAVKDKELSQTALERILQKALELR